MTIHPFPNAKPKLLGEPEDSIGIIDTPAVAGLNGTVNSTLTDVIDISVRNATGSIGSTPTETVFQSQTINYTQPKNIAFLKTKCENTDGFSNHQSTIRLRRGGLTGTILDDAILLGGNSLTLSATEIDRPIGSVLYVLTIKELNPAVISASALVYDGGFNGTAIVCNIDDTHEGTIATPATATKQINTPDTHRTHETEVFP